MLVVDATKGEFETGFDSGGQTREHALLIRSLGNNQENYFAFENINIFFHSQELLNLELL